MAVPAVSVIIPTYNRASYVLQAIESVRRQTFSDYEIIVVDDGGFDATRKLLVQYAGERFLYLRADHNVGLAAARNLGIRAARGKFIAFLDDDDLWHPEKLFRQIETFERTPDAALLHSGYRVIGPDGSARDVQPKARGRAYRQLLAWNSIAASSVIIRTDIAPEIFFDERLSGCADWDLWLRIARCHHIDYCAEPLVFYRLHSENMHKNTAVMEQDTFRILEKNAPFLTQTEYSRLRSSHAVRIAKAYYDAGVQQESIRLLGQALVWDPSYPLLMRGLPVHEQERLITEALQWVCLHEQVSHHSRTYQSAARLQYHVLAWAYYNHGSMEDFRRCIREVFRHALLKPPLRLLVPYLKSFFGKRISDTLHRVRTKIFLCKTTVNR